MTDFAKKKCVWQSIPMHADLFTNAGLTADEAYIYELLLLHGPQGAGVLLKKAKRLKRGLLYKILDRLVERGLVLNQQKAGVACFAPQSPEVLLQSIEAQERASQRSKQALQTAMPELKAKFNLSTERPVLRFFEGIEGLREIYEEKITSGAKDLYFIRTAKASEYRNAFGTWFAHYLDRQQASGLRVHALTADDAEVNHDPAVDRARHMMRTWMRPEDYTAPIEIDVYGDKTAIISFGKEIFGIVIECAPIAVAVQEVFLLAERGAKTTKVLHNHGMPKHK